MKPCYICGTMTDLYLAEKPICVDCDDQRENQQQWKRGQNPKLKLPEPKDSGESSTSN
jgi:hypothetical protein